METAPRGLGTLAEVPPFGDAREIVGVLGGMGPAATADFFAKLVRATPARVDQDHLRTIIWSDPTIPDRTAALLSGGTDPTPWLLAGARMLRAAGAGVIAVPCNTAHAFLPAVQADVGVPFVHMIEETVLHIRSRHPQVRRVGLLSTTGTQASALYDEALRRHGLEPLVPSAAAQARVMAGIGRVKAGVVDERTAWLVASAALELSDAGAEALVAGCTELPIAIASSEFSVPVIDPTQVLAEAVVAAVGSPCTG